MKPRLQADIFDNGTFRDARLKFGLRWVQFEAGVTQFHVLPGVDTRVTLKIGKDYIEFLSIDFSPPTIFLRGKRNER